MTNDKCFRDCLQSAIESQKESCVIPCPIAEERQCGGFLSDAEAKEVRDRLDIIDSFYSWSK